MHEELHNQLHSFDLQMLRRDPVLLGSHVPRADAKLLLRSCNSENGSDDDRKKEETPLVLATSFTSSVTSQQVPVPASTAPVPLSQMISASQVPSASSAVLRNTSLSSASTILPITEHQAPYDYHTPLPSPLMTTSITMSRSLVFETMSRSLVSGTMHQRTLQQHHMANTHHMDRTPQNVFRDFLLLRVFMNAFKLLMGINCLGSLLVILSPSQVGNLFWRVCESIAQL
jgi:hypothetical protein